MSTATKEQKNQVEPTASPEPETIQAAEPGPSVTKFVPLSERVRRYVLEKSGSLAEIAKVTGLPKSTLNPWLLGQKGITTGVLDKICEAYEIVSFRIDGTNSEHVPTLQSVLDEYDAIRARNSEARVKSLNSKADQVSQTIEANKKRMEAFEQNLRQMMEDFAKSVIEIERAKGGNKT